VGCNRVGHIKLEGTPDYHHWHPKFEPGWEHKKPKWMLIVVTSLQKSEQLVPSDKKSLRTHDNSILSH
jgi:hypothetical protein